MAPPLVSDALWDTIQPLPPPPPPPKQARYPGRPRLDDRKVLAGILFVLKSGIPWEMLPQEMGCGSGMTCGRRLRDWQEARVWQSLHECLLTRLHQADPLDGSRVCIDSASLRAVGGGEKNRPQSDRSQPAREQTPCAHGGPGDSPGRGTDRCPAA